MKHKIFFLAIVAALTACKTNDPTPQVGAVSFEYSIDERTVSFTNTSAPTIVSYLWSFGDDEISAEKNTRHTYAKDGTYTVTLTGWEDDEVTYYSCQRTMIVKGSAPQTPTVDFTYERIAPLMFQFTNTSYNCASYKWDYGDGMWSENKDAMHTYEATGTYTVTLTGTASDGKKYSTSKKLTVTKPTIYFAGYTLYAIPYENRYYRLSFKDDNLLPSDWDTYTIYTPLLDNTDIPYTYMFNNPIMLENPESHTYYTIALYRNTKTNNTSGDTQCLKQQLKVKDIMTYQPEYILQTETGGSVVGIHMGYDY